MYVYSYLYKCADVTAKPIFSLNINGVDAICLFDTGADVSVMGYYLLSRLKHVLRYVGKENLSGFGGKGSLVDLYAANSFILSDGVSQLVLENFPIMYDKNFKSVNQIVLSPSFCSQGRCLLSPTENNIQFYLPSNHYILSIKEMG